MKARIFPEMPSIGPVSKGVWIVEHDYTGPTIDGNSTTVKAGFETDGASIPRLARVIMGGKMQIPLIAAAVLHDGEYAAELYKRSVCDWRFLVAMQALKIGWLKRNAIYSAVRAGGWIVWGRHRISDVSHASKYVYCILPVDKLIKI